MFNKFNKMRFIKIARCSFLIILLLAVFAMFLYLKVVPSIVSNVGVQNKVVKLVKKMTGADLVIKNLHMKTRLSSAIDFHAGVISLYKNDEKLLLVAGLDSSVSFKKLLKKRIVLKKLGASYIFADVNKLSALAPKQDKQEAVKSDWRVEWFDSLLYIKKCQFLYKINEDLNVKIDGTGITVADRKNPKFMRFNIIAELGKDNQKVTFELADNNTVYIKNRALYIDDGVLKVNNSKVSINAYLGEKNIYNIKVASKKFDVKNVVDLLGTNLIIANGKEIISFFEDIKGCFDFDVNLSNDGLNGKVDVANSSFKLLPLNALPVYVQTGNIEILSNEIKLKNFKGFYGKNKRNVVAMEGNVLDYTKSVNTNILITGKATNELTRDYLSKLVGYPLSLTGDCGTRLIVKSVYNDVDIIWQFKVPKGYDILVDGASLSPVNYDRALTADMHFANNILDVKSINYYIASVLDKKTKGVRPILTIDGKFDMGKGGAVQNIGFKIPKPLPSEFLNVLIGQKMFKKGTIAGNLQMINTGEYPVIDGNMEIQQVRIPSQRLSIKSAKLYTNKNSININANGRFKRSAYSLTGNIKNSLVFPLIVKNISLSVDNIDVDRLLTSFNNQNTNAVTKIKTERQENIAQSTNDNDDEQSDDAYTFDTGLIIIEKCVLSVAKGFYKEINFGNLKAMLTLDKNGLLQVHSNKFDFAEGLSSLKVSCDLKNHKYSVALGVKEVNSDLIATTLLALKREISGKANGLIMLNTDDSLKLNGKMKFSINNGTIGKIGLVEYVLKFASLFRNPLAMISPSMLVDLVNIPEGHFDNINGELLINNNVIEKIMIKSSAPQLSSFIIGRYDLEKNDAILRIYTKFSSAHKGLAGALRNISLNSLASRVSFNSRNYSNYYAAELSQIPPIDADEKDCQVFLTKVDGDVQNNNFISSLKKIK